MVTFPTKATTYMEEKGIPIQTCRCSSPGMPISKKAYLFADIQKKSEKTEDIQVLIPALGSHSTSLGSLAMRMSIVLSPFPSVCST
ncbi:hypothetical protein AAY473_002818 [Plecturocebus cupreus]